LPYPFSFLSNVQKDFPESQVITAHNYSGYLWKILVIKREDVKKRASGEKRADDNHIYNIDFID